MTNKSNKRKMIQVVFGLLIVSVLEDFSAEGTECLLDLKNIAAYEGAKSIRMNVTGDPDDVKWTCLSTSDEYDFYLLSGQDEKKKPSLMGLYYQNQCGLEIRNAKAIPDSDPISTAGLYVAKCVDTGSVKGAKLIVVRGPPVCFCNDSMPDAVQLGCTLTYADITVPSTDAFMTWKMGGEPYTEEKPYRKMSDYMYVYQSTSIITVDKGVTADFECTVTFNELTETQYDYIATNAPEFSATCSVSVARCGLTEQSSTKAVLLPSPSTKTQSMASTQSTTSSDYCTPNLANKAVREGTLNIQMNVIASPRLVGWKVIATSEESSGRYISRCDSTIDPVLSYLYSINESGLLIRNSTASSNGFPLSTAGLYIARCNNNVVNAGVKLLVVRRGPSCSCNRTTLLLGISSPSVKVSCSVEFADSSTHPILATMTWSVSGKYHSTDTPSRIQTNQNTSIATSTITVSNLAAFSYACALTFGQPTNVQLPYIATNAPAFNESCSATCA